jgi:hypothetical protein
MNTRLNTRRMLILQQKKSAKIERLRQNIENPRRMLNATRELNLILNLVKQI